MATYTLAEVRDAFGWVAFVFAAILIVAVVSCQENPADVDIIVTDTTPAQPCDSIQCPPLPPPVHDTTYVWCWETDHNNGRNPDFTCDNGYMGPRR